MPRWLATAVLAAAAFLLTLSAADRAYAYGERVTAREWNLPSQNATPRGIDIDSTYAYATDRTNAED